MDEIIVPEVELDHGPPEKTNGNTPAADVVSERGQLHGHAVADRRVWPIDFELLEDGTLVERLQNSENANDALLLLWKDGKARYAEKFEYAGRVLVPIVKDSQVLRQIRLPKGLGPYESVRELFTDLMALFNRFVSLAEGQDAVLASFVLCSWVADWLYVAPYLALVGLSQSGKTTLLRILNLVCRRPLLVADTPVSAIYDVYGRLRPTLLIDEAGFFSEEAALRRLLRAGCTRDVNMIRGKYAYDVYGPKAISWIDPPDDAALNSRCFQIQMVESRRQLEDPSDTIAEVIADDFQARLLQFRLDSYAVLKEPESSGHIDLYQPQNMEPYRPRSRAMLKSLLAPLGDDSEFAELLHRAFQEREVSQKEPLSPEHNAVLAVLYTVIHQHTLKSGLELKDLTRQVNRILKQTREPVRLHARKIGAILTTLGFRNRFRKNTGWVLRLFRADLGRIHDLVDQHGIEPLDGFALNKCAVCAGTNKMSNKAQPATKSPTGEHREPSIRNAGSAVTKNDK